MNKQFAKTIPNHEESNQAKLDTAIQDLRDEILARLEKPGFFGNVSIEINFRSNKLNWHRVTSEFTKGSGSNSQ
jgi:hypothetical protein